MSRESERPIYSWGAVCRTLNARWHGSPNIATKTLVEAAALAAVVPCPEQERDEEERSEPGVTYKIGPATPVQWVWYGQNK